MPRVIIIQYVYAHTDEDALKVARHARMMGKRSEIITDDEYATDHKHNSPMQDLMDWANKAGVDFQPSLY